MTKPKRTTRPKAGAKKKAKTPGDEGLLSLDPGQSCHLLCFGDEYPPEFARAAVLEHLVLARAGVRGGTPWLLFAGKSPSHWRALVQWVLVSEPLPEGVFDGLCEGLRAIDFFGDFECTELTTPAQEPFVEPCFSLEASGVRLLVPPDQVDPGWSSAVLDVELRMRGWAWSRPRGPASR